MPVIRRIIRKHGRCCHVSLKEKMMDRSLNLIARSQEVFLLFTTGGNDKEFRSVNNIRETPGTTVSSIALIAF